MSDQAPVVTVKMYRRHGNLYMSIAWDGVRRAWQLGAPGAFIDGDGLWVVSREVKAKGSA